MSGWKIDASTIIVKNKVLVANMRGDLQLIDLNTGEEIWSYEIGCRIFSNPAVLENKIVVGGADGVVYLLEE